MPCHLSVGRPSGPFGGLDGVVAEGGANLSRAEIACLLATGAIAVQPALVLMDADEIGLGSAEIQQLSDLLRPKGTAALVVIRNSEIEGLFDGHIELAPKVKDAAAPAAPLSQHSNTRDHSYV